FFFATWGTKAASNCNSPSIESVSSFSLANSTAALTRSVSSDVADPFVEKLSIAIFGSTSNNFADAALVIAISAKSSLLGAILIAQSANIYRSSLRVITNIPDVSLIPGAVLMIWSAGLTVSDVDCAAALTNPSSSSIEASIVPKYLTYS